MGKDQAGSITYFLLLISASLFSLAGIAIDLVRLEKARTNFQLHLDNATFQAVFLNQPVASSTIIKNYMFSLDLKEKYHIEFTKCTNNRLRYATTTAKVKLDGLTGS